MNFNGFYGNEAAKEYLSSAFSGNSLPHALLFTGERGIGKKTLADTVSRALLCSGDAVPCGKCRSCKKALAGAHPDIIKLGFGDAPVRVDDIRALRKDAFLRPNDGERKVYIINHAETMTHSAQNAFLKILEEPPVFTFFIILCYNLTDLLPTVISRTAHIPLAPLSDSDMRRVISDKLPDLSESEVSETVRRSNGICSFLSDDGDDGSVSAAADIASALSSHDELSVFRAFSALEKKKRDEFIKIADELIIIIRDSVIISSGAKSICLSRADRSFAEKFSAEFPPDVCSKMLESLVSARADALKNIGVPHILGSLVSEFAYTAANAALKG